MTKIYPEFIVDHQVTAEIGRFMVIGRCGETPIRVGEIFDLVYRNKAIKFPEEANDDPVRIAEKPASLRVVSAHAYGKSLSGLGQVMAGVLVLEGEGAEFIAPGWILGQRDWSRALIDARNPVVEPSSAASL